MIGELLAGRALGDHGPDPRVGADGGEGLLTAHGLPEESDHARVDAGLAGQERHGGSDVPVTPPAEIHRVPAGAAVAAGVHQQRAVAVPGQHRSLGEHRGAGGSGAGQQHHGGAVARRDVPRRQPHAVGGAEGRILVGKPVGRRGGGSERPWRQVSRIDRYGQRPQHEPQQHYGPRHGQQPPPARHRPDQGGGRPAEQDHAGCQHDDPAEGAMRSLGWGPGWGGTSASDRYTRTGINWTACSTARGRYG